MPVPPIKVESRAFFRAMGKRISVLRKEQGMTQAELARALGVAQQTVFAYELGDRRVSVFILDKLAKVLDVPVEELMGMPKVVIPKKRRLSPAGIRHAERLLKLSKTEQRFVVRIIDTLLERNASPVETLTERPGASPNPHAQPNSTPKFARSITLEYRCRARTRAPAGRAGASGGQSIAWKIIRDSLWSRANARRRWKLSAKTIEGRALAACRLA